MRAAQPFANTACFWLASHFGLRACSTGLGTGRHYVVHVGASLLRPYKDSKAEKSKTGLALISKAQ